MASACPGCGAVLPAVVGPVHRYFEASPACWALYSEVLAREYSNPALMRGTHRLTVDAYAVQHPGRPSPQTVQSAAVHLVSLCALLGHGQEPEQAQRLIEAATGRKATYHWLVPPDFRGTITVGAVAADPDPAAHARQVTAWASSVWQAWKTHHAQVEEWYRQLRA